MFSGKINRPRKWKVPLWSDDERRLLLANYQDMDLDELAILLNKTVKQIKDQAQRQQLNRRSIK